ncbi:MAG: hypothetical protein JJE25_11940 [Bacteroidia bacterium]|nr:hypothetical protein [Bacteroidia bacterium]
MRIWSLHPGYLDAKGLVALWRETLLAKKVLENKTKGYRHHPQLKRFRKQKNPVGAINSYLTEIHKEALKRNYHFDKNKIGKVLSKTKITVTRGQVEYEINHLRKKLKIRDKNKLKKISSVKIKSCHPLFRIVKGKVESWEVLDK